MAKQEVIPAAQWRAARSTWNQNGHLTEVERLHRALHAALVTETVKQAAHRRGKAIAGLGILILLGFSTIGFVYLVVLAASAAWHHSG